MKRLNVTFPQVKKKRSKLLGICHLRISSNARKKKRHYKMQKRERMEITYYFCLIIRLSANDSIIAASAWHKVTQTTIDTHRLTWLSSVNNNFTGFPNHLYLMIRLFTLIRTRMAVYHWNRFPPMYIIYNLVDTDTLEEFLSITDTWKSFLKLFVSF